MLVIGDHGAKELLHGIRYHFNGIYSKLIVISSDSCVPFLNKDFSMDEAKCLKFSQQVRSLVASWPSGVDLLVLSYK